MSEDPSSRTNLITADYHRKLELFATQTIPWKSRTRSAWFSRVELIYWRCQSRRFTRENSANIHAPVWRRVQNFRAACGCHML